MLGTAISGGSPAVPSRFLPSVPVCPALLCRSGVLHHRRRKQNQRSQQTDQQFDHTHSPHLLSANAVRRKGGSHPSKDHSTKLAERLRDQTIFGSGCVDCGPSQSPTQQKRGHVIKSPVHAPRSYIIEVVQKGGRTLWRMAASSTEMLPHVPQNVRSVRISVCFLALRKSYLPPF